MIKIFAIDIDGVITNGTVTLDHKGNEYKVINYIDIDAISLLRKNSIKIALITGESGAMVDVIGKKLNADIIFKSVKNKKDKIKEILSSFNLSSEQISFIGDSKKDAEALRMLEYSFAPSNGDKYAKEAAKNILISSGGNGVVREAVDLLIKTETIVLSET
jgi:3-deoxy-D-manno-octulosonate 8-phosphate phosphatase (KDO 8-P phosphatase)